MLDSTSTTPSEEGGGADEELHMEEEKDGSGRMRTRIGE
ncbi:hypothetical protein A2U01_0035063 [Trifolium medium]|uniref:Uncharacterized protein n=1 Tax=Trifolium medium TaxID=97028 RepID=A0A392PR65_9FABA|nr:hypothetical protein [Trifolium medium]